MINHREILRLESLGLNNTQIAASCECARSTVIEVMQRAKAKGLRYPLPEDMTDRELANALGILTLPTMLLIDKDGKVVNRNLHGEDVDTELRKLLR